MCLGYAICRRWWRFQRTCRRWRLALFCERCGRTVSVVGQPVLRNAERLSIGEGCTINHGVVFSAKGGITIGRDVRISNYVVLETAQLDVHDMTSGHVHICKPIVVGDHVWIATGAIILPGVTIGDGAVIAAGAVVSRDVPAYHLAKGVPARFEFLPERQATLTRSDTAEAGSTADAEQADGCPDDASLA